MSDGLRELGATEKRYSLGLVLNTAWKSAPSVLIPRLVNLAAIKVRGRQVCQPRTVGLRDMIWLMKTWFIPQYYRIQTFGPQIRIGPLTPYAFRRTKVCFIVIGTLCNRDYHDASYCQPKDRVREYWELTYCFHSPFLLFKEWQQQKRRKVRGYVC